MAPGSFLKPSTPSTPSAWLKLRNGNKSLLADPTNLAMDHLCPDTIIEAKKGRDGASKLQVVRRRQDSTASSGSSNGDIGVGGDNKHV